MKIAILMCMAVTLLGLGVTAPVAAWTLKPSCYPANEFRLAKGPVTMPVPFTASGMATATNGKGEIEIPPALATFPISATASSVTWEFGQNVTSNTGLPFLVTPTSMTGKLMICIKWSSPTLPDTMFVADCIAEAQVDSGDAIEAELEGTVTNFPYQTRPRVAVASIRAKKGSGGIGIGDWKIGIEIGTTCFSTFQMVPPVGLFDEFELALGGSSANGSLSISPLVSSGRAALPAGFTPSFAPCVGVVF
jgi:hypothetical protein